MTLPTDLALPMTYCLLTRGEWRRPPCRLMWPLQSGADQLGRPPLDCATAAAFRLPAWRLTPASAAKSCSCSKSEFND